MRAAAAELTQLLGTGEQSMLMAAEKVENGPHDRRKEGEANGVSPSLRRRPGVEIPCPAVVGVGNKANVREVTPGLPALGKRVGRHAESVTRAPQVHLRQ